MSLVVLLALGCGLNLLFIHIDPFSLPSGTQVHRKVRVQIWDRGLPTIPSDVIDQLGSFYVWERNDYAYHTEWLAMWILSDASPPIDSPNYYMIEQRHGLPLTARSTKAVRYHRQPLIQGTQTEGTIWPQVGNIQVQPDATYHPLGLIFNPIIYALPVWMVLMGLRWLLLTQRMRRRGRLELCVECGYAIGDLAVCPECGGS